MSWEIAGVVISGLSLINDLFRQFKDASAWTESDLPIDGENWLKLAIEKDLLPGPLNSYKFAREERVSSLELERRAAVVYAFNDERKCKYRLCWGRPGDRLILMRNILPAPDAPQ
jgi:hypothetical protein